jgi:hypothetical protein
VTSQKRMSWEKQLENATVSAPVQPASSATFIDLLHAAYKRALLSSIKSCHEPVEYTRHSQQPANASDIQDYTFFCNGCRKG